MFKFKKRQFEDLSNNFIEYYSSPLEERHILRSKFYKDNAMFEMQVNDDIDSYLFVSGRLTSDSAFVKAEELIQDHMESEILWCVFAEDSVDAFTIEWFERIGLHLHDTYQGMILAKQNFKPFEVDLLPGQSIELVDTPQLVKEFEAIMESSFDLSTIEITKYKGIAEVNQSTPVSKMILIKDGDNYVATGQVYLDRETAVIDDICVHKDFRGHGYSKLLMNSLISAAFTAGKETVSLFATTAGFPVYKHLGFIEQDFYLEVYSRNDD